MWNKKLANECASASLQQTIGLGICGICYDQLPFGGLGKRFALKCLEPYE
jgi:hypothetical protein